jgi:hypothetical protein
MTDNAENACQSRMTAEQMRDRETVKIGVLLERLTEQVATQQRWLEEQNKLLFGENGTDGVIGRCHANELKLREEIKTRKRRDKFTVSMLGAAFMGMFAALWNSIKGGPG